jgi:hypothetical protein
LLSTTTSPPIYRFLISVFPELGAMTRHVQITHKSWEEIRTHLKFSEQTAGDLTVLSENDVLMLCMSNEDRVKIITA